MRASYFVVLIAACGRIDFDPASVCIAGAGEHDEDGDGVIDRCDNCPGIANPDQANRMELAAADVADSIGDACDPRPLRGGDTLLVFESFDQPLGPDWIVIQGSWQQHDGVLAQYALDTSAHIFVRLDTQNVAAETRLVFDVFGVPESFGLVDVRSQPDPTGFFDGYNCGVSTPQTALMHTIDNSAPILARTLPLAQPVTVGSSHQVRTGIFDSALRCRIDEVEIADADTTYPVGMGAGLASVRAQAHFEYFAVYELGGPL